MTAPLLPIHIMSIYKVAGQPVPLPKRMALATPDMKAALAHIGEEVARHQGRFVLSDLYRSYDMQLQAHLDFKSGKKTAFSPAPGGSMHEAGRAFDVDVAALRMPLAGFWELCKPMGVVPIIDTPTAGANESWHFECRGSHQRVYDYYREKLGRNFRSPAAAMAASAIVCTGVPVDSFGAVTLGAQIQSAVIRLGKIIGNLDGDVGPKTRAALEELELGGLDPREQLERLHRRLQEQYPAEYFDSVPDGGLDD
jgi:hypothetical protein